LLIGASLKKTQQWGQNLFQLQWIPARLDIIIRAAPMLRLSSIAVKKIIIEGITENGRKFRPSDWAERMSGALSTFGRDHRIQYSPMLQPMTVNGIKCVSVDPHLKDSYPEMFAYIMRWVDMNHLKTIEVDDEEPFDLDDNVSQATG
jgi:hypothetical protein